MQSTRNAELDLDLNKLLEEMVSKHGLVRLIEESRQKIYQALSKAFAEGLDNPKEGSPEYKKKRKFEELWAKLKEKLEDKKIAYNSAQSLLVDINIQDYNIDLSDAKKAMLEQVVYLYHAISHPLAQLNQIHDDYQAYDLNNNYLSPALKQAADCENRLYRLENIIETQANDSELTPVTPLSLLYLFQDLAQLLGVRLEWHVPAQAQYPLSGNKALVLLREGRAPAAIAALNQAWWQSDKQEQKRLLNKYAATLEGERLNIDRWIKKLYKKLNKTRNVCQKIVEQIKKITTRRDTIKETLRLIDALKNDNIDNLNHLAESVSKICNDQSKSHHVLNASWSRAAETINLSLKVIAANIKRFTDLYEPEHANITGGCQKISSQIENINNRLAVLEFVGKLHAAWPALNKAFTDKAAIYLSYTQEEPSCLASFGLFCCPGSTEDERKPLLANNKISRYDENDLSDDDYLDEEGLFDDSDDDIPTLAGNPVVLPDNDIVEEQPPSSQSAVSSASVPLPASQTEKKTPISGANTNTVNQNGNPPPQSLTGYVLNAPGTIFNKGKSVVTTVIGYVPYLNQALLWSGSGGNSVNQDNTTIQAPRNK